MSISLVGGPLDGAVSELHSQLPVYLIAKDHCDSPIYKRACCCKTETTHKAVPYVFVGYESDSYRWSEENIFQLDLN